MSLSTLVLRAPFVARLRGVTYRAIRDDDVGLYADLGFGPTAVRPPAAGRSSGSEGACGGEGAHRTTREPLFP